MSDPEWIAKLRKELLLAPMKNNYTFSRDEVMALLAAAPDDAKDAARYRWLRDAENGGELSVGRHIAVCDGEPQFEQVDWLYIEELDAAIDAAMQPTPQMGD